VNIAKGNRTPFEAFGNEFEQWGKIEILLNGVVVQKGVQGGMRPGNIKRFLARSMPGAEHSGSARDPQGEQPHAGLRREGSTL
jgi:hypothetical protein